MSNAKILTLAGVSMFSMLLPQAKADDLNQKTVFTFGGPVEVPGQVLSPGTYVFKLVDSQSDRNIVQVYDKDESHLYGTFLAIPDYRQKPAGKPIIMFEERVAGAPEAIKGWFYPGNNFGHQFVYPKVKAAELAKTNKQPVPSMPTELAASTTNPTTTKTAPEAVQIKQASLKVQRPTATPPAAQAVANPPEAVVEEVEIAEVFLPPPPANALPATASYFPRFGLIGLMLLGSAVALSDQNRIKR